MRSTQSPKSLGPRQACTACRRHKVKCTGERPACRNCTTMERVCGYLPSAPSSSTLEERLRTLEAQLFEFESLQNATPYESSDSDSSASRSSSASSYQQSFRISSPGIPIVGSKQWDHAGPAPLKCELFKSFLSHYREYNLDLYVPLWQQAMSYPSSHPESLHPALLNAIYYSACSSPSFPSAYRDLFLYRAREEMRVSLSWCDRIEHWLYASIIIASVQSRIGSAGLDNCAQVISACAELISIAYACNLHKFDDPACYKNFDWGLMNTPRNEFHASERLNLWWTIFVLERSTSIALSVPGSIPMKPSMFITTVFPIPWDEVAKYGLGGRSGCDMHKHLKTNEMSRSVAVAVRDTILGMHAKAISTYSLASHVAQSLADDPDHSHDDYAVTDVRLLTMLSTLPLFAESSQCRTACSARSSSLCPSEYINLICIHLCVLSAEIIHTGVYASQDPGLSSRRLNAAQSMATLGRTIRDGRYSCCPNILLGTFWHSGAAVLVREIERSRCTDDYTDDYANIQVIQSDLAMILRCMGLFNPTDPEITTYIDEIKARFFNS